MIPSEEFADVTLASEDTELRNVKFLTQSKSLESSFTPRKERKWRQILHINLTKWR